jgi:hypothetical protein
MSRRARRNHSAAFKAKVRRPPHLGEVGAGPILYDNSALAGASNKDQVVGLFTGDAVDLMIYFALVNDLRSSTILPGQPQA